MFFLINFGLFQKCYSYKRHKSDTSHPDPIGADYEQAFAGANFNTEVVSGALVEVSGCHFKALATLKVSGDPFEAPLKSPDLYLPAADNFCERSGHNLMK